MEYLAAVYLILVITVYILTGGAGNDTKQK
jgi:hypothetical protein